MDFPAVFQAVNEFQRRVATIHRRPRELEMERELLAVWAIERAVDEAFEMLAADIAERYLDAWQAFRAGFAQRLSAGKPQPADLADRRVEPVQTINRRCFHV